jgi:hypothetical protein
MEKRMPVALETIGIHTTVWSFQIWIGNWVRVVDGSIGLEKAPLVLDGGRRMGIIPPLVAPPEGHPHPIRGFPRHDVNADEDEIALPVIRTPYNGSNSDRMQRNLGQSLLTDRSVIKTA